MTIIDVINTLSTWVIPCIVVIIPLYGLYKKVPVYETFVEGAKEGFQVAVRIIPYLVAILFAVGMFRASGCIAILGKLFEPILVFIGMPIDVLPIAIIRPLSGSGSMGLLADVAHTHGADSFIAKMAATMVGSSDTTFYILAVYFGAVGIKKFRHALFAGLLADVAGIVTSVFICRALFL